MEAENSQIEWLEFDLLLDYPKVLNKVFLRHGGTSKGPFATLNVGDQVGDHLDCVKANRELIQNVCKVKKVIYANQVHGSDVLKVHANDTKIKPADAIYTDEKNIALAISHADCQAAILYEPNKEIIAVIHAGWKGLVGGVYENCIQTLITSEGGKAKDMILCISPSLGVDHSEFTQYKKEIPEDLWSYQSKGNYFDLKEMAKQKCMSMGVLEKNIEISDICTYCEEKDYFSYRRNKKCGRHATIAGIFS